MRQNKFLISVVVFIFIFMFPARANSPVMTEADIDNMKAAFIYNFTKYITWPHMDNFNVFRIGLIGDSKIVVPFQQMAEKKMVGNKPIVFRNYDDIQTMSFCHILFISESEGDRIVQILSKLTDRSTLTVGDTPGFCKRGIMTNFFSEGGKVKFEMNTAKLESVGLKASSQLQKLARIIE
ncbi:MAG: YfiR family protein [Candidatus Marinimicrobia bacterium]|nr:YfiR family protein [Candidatus Neomarinimicrobiota bacterium]